MAEGRKIVQEAINEKQDIPYLVGTSDFLNSLSSASNETQIVEVGSEQVGELSTLSTNSDGFALVKISEQEDNLAIPKWSVYLDGVNDPGNLGTIIRTADWFGLDKIYCSIGTCDRYNPKAVMATMGSVFRVSVTYIDLKNLLSNNPGLQILGADLQGVPFSNLSFDKGPGLILLGSEANGISDESRQLVNTFFKIEGKGKAESLNVAQSSAIILNKIYLEGRF